MGVGAPQQLDVVLVGGLDQRHLVRTLRLEDGPQLARGRRVGAGRLAGQTQGQRQPVGLADGQFTCGRWRQPGLQTVRRRGYRPGHREIVDPAIHDI